MILSGKNIILTGGSQGLGKEIAKKFLQNGAFVAICARDDIILKEAYDELLQYKSDEQQLLIGKTDISNNSEVEEFVLLCLKTFKKIDILVNNAGIHGSKNTIDEEKFDFDGWISAININLIGTLNMCHAVVPYLKQNKSGKIINLSGGGATSPMPGMSAYAASKAAVVRLTETIALELKQFKIDVNAVAPGAMNTRLLNDVLSNGRGKVTEEYYQKALEQRKNGGTPPSLAAELCVYLASDESNGITGKLISAVWDDWKNLHNNLDKLDSDIYTLRRIVPEDRDMCFN